MKSQGFLLPVVNCSLIRYSAEQAAVGSLAIIIVSVTYRKLVLCPAGARDTLTERADGLLNPVDLGLGSSCAIYHQS